MPLLYRRAQEAPTVTTKEPGLYFSKGAAQMEDNEIVFPSNEQLDLEARLKNYTGLEGYSKTPRASAKALLALGVDGEKFYEYREACKKYNFTAGTVETLAAADIPPILAWRLSEAAADKKGYTALEAVAAWENFKSRLSRITRPGIAWADTSENISKEIAVRGAVLGLAPEKINGTVVTWLELYPKITAGQLEDVLAGRSPCLDPRRKSSKIWKAEYGDIPTMLQLDWDEINIGGKYAPMKPKLLAGGPEAAAARMRPWALALPGTDVTTLCYLHEKCHTVEMLKTLTGSLPGLNTTEIATIAGMFSQYGEVFTKTDKDRNIVLDDYKVGYWLTALKANNKDFGPAMVYAILDAKDKTSKKTAPPTGKLGLIQRRKIVAKLGRFAGGTAWESIQLENYFRKCGAIDPHKLSKAKIPTYKVSGVALRNIETPEKQDGAETRIRAVKEEYGRLMGEYSTFFDMPAFLSKDFKPASDLLELLVEHENLTAKGADESELAKSAESCETALAKAEADARKLGFGYVAGPDVGAVVMKTLTSAKESMQLAQRATTEEEERRALEAAQRKLEKAGELLGGPGKFRSRGMLPGVRSIETSEGITF